MNKTTRLLWFLLVASFILAGLLLVTGAALPFDTLKSTGDRLSKDGNLQSLTLESYQAWHLPAGVLGAVLLALGMLMLAWRKASQGILQGFTRRLSRTWQAFIQDWRLLFADLRAHRPETKTVILLLGITLLALAVRLVFISRPMTHDESYTFKIFAQLPFSYLVSDYHKPNNHIFHTILVRISYLLFGQQPWAVRLPAFLAGVLLVPAGYLLGRMLYDQYAALLGAAFLAVFPTLIEYSIQARGYTLLTLFTLLVFALAVYVKNHRNRAAWFLLVLFSTLGFYTIPIMLMPFGIVFLWLFLSGMIEDTSPDYPSRLVWLKYLVVAGTLVVLFTAVLYTPVFLRYGVNAVIANPTVRSINDFDLFKDTATARLEDTWREWNQDVPAPVMLLLAAGFISSLLLHWRIGPLRVALAERRFSRVRIPIQIPAALWIVSYVVIQEMKPLARIWVFLLALILLWAAAGLVSPFRRLHIKLFRNQSLAGILLGIGLLAVLAGGIYRSALYYPVPMGDPQQVTLFLKNELREDDICVIVPPDDLPYMYYFDLYNVPGKYIFDIRVRPFHRSLVVVNASYQQTVESVVDERGPELPFLLMNQARKITQTGDTSVFEIPANLRVMQETYGTYGK